jgi:hypothetical protein
MDLARKGAWLIGSSLALALLVTPFALGAGEGKPVKLGKRNPPKGAAKKTTQVFAKTKAGKYTMKFTNTRAGGAGLLSCKSALNVVDIANPKLSTPCLRVSNSRAGEAFQFHSATGALVGLIQVGSSLTTPNPNARPFVTNATGEALGLNADKVDGLNAADIITAARADAPAGEAPSFAFARVAAPGTTDQSRSQGVTDTNIKKGGVGVYCFDSLSSRPKNASVTLDGVPGEVAVDTTTRTGTGCPDEAKLDLIVRTYDSAGTPTDKPFYISITGTTGA